MSRSASLRSLALFGFSTILISLTLSLVATPWLNLPWWKVFRRCVSIAAAISLWILIGKLEKRSLRSYGFLISSREGKRQLLFGVLLGLAALGLMLGIGLASGAYRIDITPDRGRLWRTVLGFLPLAALVSVLEELVFRGFLLQHLIVFSRSAAVIASSALYAVVHVKNTAEFGLLNWLELGGLFLFGSVLSITYLATKQLSLALGLHTIFAYAARVNKFVLEFPDPTVYWLMGTGRMVNGLMSWVVLLGMGGIVIWWARSSQRGGAHDTSG